MKMFALTMTLIFAAGVALAQCPMMSSMSTTGTQQQAVVIYQLVPTSAMPSTAMLPAGTQPMAFPQGQTFALVPIGTMPSSMWTTAGAMPAQMMPMTSQGIPWSGQVVYIPASTMNVATVPANNMNVVTVPASTVNVATVPSGNVILTPVPTTLVAGTSQCFIATPRKIREY